MLGEPEGQVLCGQTGTSAPRHGLEPTFTSSSRCPPFLVFSSIWSGCAHPLRKGCCSRETLPWGHQGVGGKTAATEPQPTSRVAQAVSRAALGQHHTAQGPRPGIGNGQGPGRDTQSEEGPGPSPPWAMSNPQARDGRRLGGAGSRESGTPA